MLVDYPLIASRLRLDLEPWLTDNPFITSDMGLRQVACKSLSDSFYKKLQPLGDTKDADAKALKKFIAINESIPEGPWEFNSESEVDDLLWNYFVDAFRKSIAFEIEGVNFDLAYIRENMGLGPGANVNMDSRSFFTKLFTGPMSYTHPHLITLYRGALAETGLWAEAEMLRFNKHGFDKVDGGVLFFAVKNAEISRTCCTEPILNMLIQKSIGAFLESRLKSHFGISLSTQPAYNQELARIGSVDGSFGTMDLVSASDSMRRQLIHVLLKNEPNLSVPLFSSACERAILPDSSEIVLRMISTMGNGFTFPLQTLIFASAVRAVYSLMGLPSYDPQHQFGVFGDDIVVRREAYERLRSFLTKIGFEVNDGKSFNTGSFRESCGCDYFSGSDVRGVYIRHLETPQAVCSSINRLLRWSARQGIPLSNTIAALRALLKKEYFVPRSESDDAGIKVPFISTKPLVSDSQYWFKYRYYKQKSRRLTFDERKIQNPPGLGVSVLSGHTQTLPYDVSYEDMDKDFPSHEVTLREPPSARPRYKVAGSSLPYWDLEYPIHWEYQLCPDGRNWQLIRSGAIDISVGGWTLRGHRNAPRDNVWENVVLAVLNI